MIVHSIDSKQLLFIIDKYLWRVKTSEDTSELIDEESGTESNLRNRFSFAFMAYEGGISYRKYYTGLYDVRSEPLQWLV